MAGSYSHAIAPGGLSDEDRHHGYVALALIGDWDAWVKRRVESIEFVSDTSVRRSTSVDFRIRSWLPPAILKWDGADMHYFPLTLLRKKSLTDFDLYDEEGRSLSLLTRDKNTAIAAAALSALAQTTIWTSLAAQFGRDRVKTGFNGLPTGPKLIRVPRAIEDDFTRLSYLPFEGGEQGNNASEVLAGFLGERPDDPRLLSQWNWSFEDGEYVSDATEAEWRWLLGSDERQRTLMADMAELWIVATPIADRKKQRRIIKFRYLEPLPEERMLILDNRRAIAQKLGVLKILSNFEDRIEGLKDGREGSREWKYHQASGSAEPVRVTLGQKILQGLGWRASVVEFNVPAVAEGGTYHLEVQAPEGIQVRRAHLAAMHGEVLSRSYALRGARSLQRAHLYVGDVDPPAGGQASVALKPRTTTMVRALALLSMVSFLVLAFVRLRLGTIAGFGEGSPVDIVPLLLLIPGFLAASISRSGENSMTTSMLFGLRCLANLLAFWPLAGAVLLATAADSPCLAEFWAVLLIGSGLTTLILLATWRLNGRRRPDGNSP